MNRKRRVRRVLLALGLVVIASPLSTGCSGVCTVVPGVGAACVPS